MTPEETARLAARTLWAEDNVPRSLGMELVEIGPGRATLAMKVGPEMTNGHGICHGGYVFLLADSACAFACHTRGSRWVTQWAQVSFLAPGRLGARLAAEAVERHRGERSGLTDVTVRDEHGVTIAEFRGASRTIAGELAART